MATSDEDVPAEFLAAAAGFIQAAVTRRVGPTSAPAPERVALFPDLTPEEEQAAALLACVEMIRTGQTRS